MPLADFGDMIDIYKVWNEDAVTGAGLCFLFREQMHISYAATDSHYHSLSPSSRMPFDHSLWPGNLPRQLRLFL